LVDHLLALLVGVAMPLGAAVSSVAASGETLTSAEKVRLYWLNSASLWAFALVVVGAHAWRGRALATLGLRLPDWSGVATLVVAVLLVAFALDAAWQTRDAAARQRTRERMLHDSPFMPATTRELAHFVVLALSAGVSEELLFRGFLIRYLEALLGTSAAAEATAIAAPALVFGVAPAYQGALAVAKVMVLAVAFGVLFVATSSLLVPIVLHALLDLGMGALGLALVRGGGLESAPPGRAGP
jgi:membrane protease YdiL (CAAX protease family)